MEKDNNFDELFYYSLYGKPGVLTDDDPLLVTYRNQTLPPEQQLPVPEVETEDPVLLDFLSRKKIPKPPEIEDKLPEQLIEDKRDENVPVYRHSYILNFNWNNVKGEYRTLDEDKYLEVDVENPTPRMCRLMTMVIFKLLVYLDQRLSTIHKKCLLDISEVQDKILKLKASESIEDARKMSWLNIYGMPYFKDKDYFVCPPNEDVYRKKRNNELTITDLQGFYDWNLADRVKLEQAIKNEEIKKRSQKVKRDKLKLSKSLKAAKSKQEKSELKQKISELPSLKKFEEMSLEELCEDIEWEYDWLKISAQDFQGGKHPEDCRAAWRMHFHPQINKDEWTDEENKRLKELVKEHNFQNWEAITEELGTKRTPILVMQHYQRHLNEDFTNKAWTEEEDELLIQLVSTYTFGCRISWGEVAQNLKGHTKQQIYKRWMYSVNPNLCKGPFTKSEDMLLVAAVRSFGNNHSKLLDLFPYRSSEQLRMRYRALTRLQPNTWNDDENEKLLSLVEKFGENRWIDISKHFNDQTPSSLKERYATLRKRKLQITDSSSESDDKEDTVSEEHKLWKKIKKVCPVLKEHDKLDMNSLKDLKNMLFKDKKMPYQNFRNLTVFDKECYDYFKCVTHPDALYENELYENKRRLEKLAVLKDILYLVLAKLWIPNAEFLASHPLLKTRDQEQLNELSEEPFVVSNEKTQDEVCVKYSVPLNLTTLSGFCSIMLHRRYVLDEQEQEEKKKVYVKTAKKDYLFRERFRCLFLWPAFATIVPPAIGKSAPIEDPLNHSSEVIVPRKRKRKPTRVELLNILGPKKKQKYTKTKVNELFFSNEKSSSSSDSTFSTSSNVHKSNYSTFVKVKEENIYQTQLKSEKIVKQQPTNSLSCSSPEENKQWASMVLSSTSLSCSSASAMSKKEHGDTSFPSTSFAVAAPGETFGFNSVKCIRTYSRVKKPNIVSEET